MQATNSDWHSQVMFSIPFSKDALVPFYEAFPLFNSTKSGKTSG
jgi:hypothetical protein